MSVLPEYMEENRAATSHHIPNFRNDGPELSLPVFNVMQHLSYF
jgi:hypothetical protein